MPNTSGTGPTSFFHPIVVSRLAASNILELLSRYSDSNQQPHAAFISVLEVDTITSYVDSTISYIETLSINYDSHKLGLGAVKKIENPHDMSRFI